MKSFLFNVALALVWISLTGSFSEWNFIAGMLVGAAVVEGYTRARRSAPYLAKIGRLFSFTLYFLRILVKANLQVAWEVVTPKHTMQPRILRYPIGGLTDVERVTLANAITLTPGTLVIDVSPDNEWLYIHAMYAKDEEAALRDIDELSLRLRRGVFT